MKRLSAKRTLILTAVFISVTFLSAMRDVRLVSASDRLAEFSDMVKQIDAEAEGDGAEASGSKPKEASTPANKTETAPAANPQSGTSKKVPVPKTTGEAGDGSDHQDNTSIFMNLATGSELLITVGAESCMDGKMAYKEDTKSGSTKSVETGGESQSPERTASGKGGDRLSDFASLVRDAEAEAGITDSDPESEPVLKSKEGDDRLSDFARYAADQDGDLAVSDSRLEEFARLAGDAGGEGVDARLVEFAELSGGSSDMVDDRIVAMAKVSEEHEKDMEKKYGPKIEDHIVSSPSEYKDGDRVVATANTKPKSVKAYDLLDKGSESDADSSGWSRIIGAIHTGLKDKKDGSGDGARSESVKDGFSISGFFEDIRDRVTEFTYSEEDAINLGTFTLTAYDACIICCGKTDGITSTNTHAKAGRTVAVDPSLIPYGTKVMINGHVYTAEDTGSAIKGRKIDIYMDTHEEAKQFGVKQAEVFLVR